jgi:ribosomal-protein-alanine N-acetyltransferase
MPPILRTSRCELRPVTAADTAELHALWISPGVRRFLWDNEIITVERAVETVSLSEYLFKRRRPGLWAVRRKGSPAIDGFAGFLLFREPPVYELLFGIAEPLWGQGLAVEAARAVMVYCAASFEMRVFRASTDAGNAASVRVLDKLGFRQVRRAVVDGLDTIFFERGAMPIKSKAQRRKFAQLLVEGKISPETFEEWNRGAGSRELPERVTPKKRKAKRNTRKRKSASAAPKRNARRRTKKR